MRKSPFNIDLLVLLWKKRILATLLILLPYSNVGFAEQRSLLYATSLSEPLKAIVAKLQDSQQQPLTFDQLPTQSNYYARIVPRQHILEANNTLSEKAILGTKPFVFFTIPEGLYGKSLLDSYLDIGYETEDIIRWQRDADMVVVIFRYPETITIAETQEGTLPEEWKNKVYVPTWANIFSLLEKLAEEATIKPDKRGEFAPERMFFTSRIQQQFVLSFPEEGKKRIQTVEYNVLKNMGGADWVYRDLLERKLSIFEHFRGNGKTLNEIIDPKGIHHEVGLPEFVGPNMKIKELPEVAVVHLGKLVMQNVYGNTSPTTQGSPEK